MYDPAENLTTTESVEAPVSVLDPAELLASIDISRQSEYLHAKEIQVKDLTEMGRRQAATISAGQALMVRTVAGLIASSQAISGCTMSQYVAAKWGLQSSEANRLVRLAEGLIEFPKIAQAFYDGQISEVTCDLIVRKGNPAIEDEILHTAANATGPQLAVMLNDYQKKMAKPDPYDPNPDPNPEPEPSKFSYGWSSEGRYWLKGDLNAETGEIVDTALAACKDRLFADRTAQDPDHPDIAPEGGDGITAVDVLEELAHSGIGESADDDGILPERLTNTIHFDFDLFTTGEATGNDLYLQHGGAIPASLADRLLCGSTIRSYLCDHNIPLWEAKATRTATAAQRRALEIRDRTCRYPGCGCTRRLIPHHIEPYALNGPTALDNLVLLCSRHHKTIHMFGLTNWLDDTYRYHVNGTDGTPVATPRPPAGRLPETPPHKDRLRGYSEPLTFYARDGVLHNWLEATERNTPPPEPDPQPAAAAAAAT